jgi:hypothetical protein
MAAVDRRAIPDKDYPARHLPPRVIEIGDDVADQISVRQWMMAASRRWQAWRFGFWELQWMA